MAQTRRQFFKSLATLGAAAVVAPKFLFQQARELPAKALGAIYGAKKSRFNSKDFGVISVDTYVKKKEGNRA